MKPDQFATCSLDDLSTVTGGNEQQPHWNLNSIPPSAWKPSGYVSKRNPLIRWGKPDHPTPLPTPYIDGSFPFFHIF